MTKQADQPHALLNNETPADFLRRVVSNIDVEQEHVLDDITSPEGVLAFFDLWATYDTEFLEGIHSCITDGGNPKPLRDFIETHVSVKQRRAWIADLNHYTGLAESAATKGGK